MGVAKSLGLVAVRESSKHDEASNVVFRCRSGAGCVRLRKFISGFAHSRQPNRRNWSCIRSACVPARNNVARQAQ